MSKRLYYFPPKDRDGGYGNPYSLNYREALGKLYRVVNIRWMLALAKSLAFLINSFRADVYVLNWLENIAFFRLGRFQFLFVRLGLWVIRKRGKQIVWMFHNIHPHGGHNSCSLWLHRYLFKFASLIITHSQEAAEYARKQAQVKVLYVCHPVHDIALSPTKVEAEPCDVFIWGSIIPYKGIYEFLEQAHKRKSNLCIRILGKCQDKNLASSIVSLSGGNVCFENRRADFSEIAAYCRKSRYVLFPYVGSCVSSSGALIDTLVLGGTPVGPTVGAFKDLLDEGVCLTYQDYDDLFQLLSSDHSINPNQREDFLQRNSWDALARRVKDNL